MKKQFIYKLVLCLFLLSPQYLKAQDNFNVSEIGRIYKSWDSAQAFVVRDNIIFQATRTTGLQVIDVSDFDSFPIIGELPQLSQTVSRLVNDGNRLFAVDSTVGVFIINTEHPDSMYEYSLIEATHIANDIAVLGRYAYLADGEAGLRIIDISDPVNPNLISCCNEPGDVSAVEIHDRYVYISDRKNAFYIVDVSNPREPCVAGMTECDTPLYDVVVDRDFAYARNDDGFVIINISDVNHPIEEGVYEDRGGCIDVTVGGNNVFIIDNDGRIHIIDVTDTAEPEEYRQLSNCREARDIELYGALLYVLDADSGVKVIDGFNFQDVATIRHPEYNIVDVTLNARIGYAADLHTGFLVFDFSEPIRPRHIAGFPGDEYIVGLDYQNDIVYMLGQQPRSRLRLIDVSDTSNIEQISEICFDSDQRNSCDIFVEGRYSYTISNRRNDSYLTIIDHWDIRNSHQIGCLQLYNKAYRVEIDDNYAYIAASDLYLIDIEDRSNPSVAGTYESEDTVRAVTVRNNLAYLANGIEGLTILDISEEYDPGVVGGHSFERSEGEVGAVDIALNGNYIYLLDRELGLLVYNVRAPSFPVLVGRSPVRGEPQKLALTDNLVVIAEKFGLGIYDPSEALYSSEPEIRPTKDLILLQSYPNPFNQRAIVQFTVPYTGYVNLDVYDLNGRQVRTLLHDSWEVSGIHPIFLNADGLPAGSYLLHLETGGKVTRKLVQLVR